MANYKWVKTKQENPEQTAYYMVMVAVGKGLFAKKEKCVRLYDTEKGMWECNGREAVVKWFKKSEDE